MENVLSFVDAVRKVMYSYELDLSEINEAAKRLKESSAGDELSCTIADEWEEYRKSKLDKATEIELNTLFKEYSRYA